MGGGKNVGWTIGPNGDFISISCLYFFLLLFFFFFLILRFILKVEGEKGKVKGEREEKKI